MVHRMCSNRVGTGTDGQVGMPQARGRALVASSPDDWAMFAGSLLYTTRDAGVTGVRTGCRRAPRSQTRSMNRSSTRRDQSPKGLKLPPAIQACLFDLDGVLTDTARIHTEA